MLEMIFTVCMVNLSTYCREVIIPVMAEKVTPQNCLLYGQVNAALWAHDNPHWSIKLSRETPLVCREARLFASF